MFRTRYFRTLMIAAAAAAAACTADPVYPDDPEGNNPIENAEPASLTLNFSIADLGIDVSTRANDDLLNDAFPGAGLMDPNTPWPELRKGTDEKPLTAADHEYNYYLNEGSLIDGWKMSCLTVILINYGEDKIVGVRRIPDPDCPNHNVQYLEGDHAYPPNPNDPDYDKHVAETKLNCILNEDGSLAEVLRDIHGNPVVDNPTDKHIEGLIGTKACVTFKYEDPKHIVDQDMLNACAEKEFPDDVAKQNDYKKNNEKYLGQSAEKLVRGKYTLLVVANYDHNVTTSVASGGSSDEDKFPTLNVDKTLENLTNEFHKPENMAKGIPNFRVDYKYLYDIRFLMNHTLEEVTTQADGQPATVSYNVVDLPGGLKPYIRPAVHQTLSAARDIYLEAGENVIDIELLRIASRTRVEVKNYAGEELKVHSLEFSPNYTQSTCYLFRRNKEDADHHFRDYSELASTTTGLYDDHDGKGAPMVDYTGIHNLVNGDPTYGAIVPFIKDCDFDGKDGVKDGVKVEARQKRCIFDALMYESHLDYKDDPNEPDAFYYTIDVSYPSVTDYVANSINKIDRDKTYRFIEIDKTKIEYEPAIVDEVTGKKGYVIPAHGAKSGQDLLNSKNSIEATLNYDDKIGDKNNNGYLDKGEVLGFFIQGVQSEKYLFETDEHKIHAEYKGIEPSTTGINVDSYLWIIEDLEKETDEIYSCYLKNYGSGRYMSEIQPAPEDNKVNDGNCITTVEKIENAKKCKLVFSDLNYNGSGHTGVYNAAFYNPDKDRYLSVWAGGPYISGYTIADRGCQYRLYPMKRVPMQFYKGTPRIKKKVALTTFSDATGYSQKVREIKRNDFIRILVEVSYNKGTKEFEFEVNPWEKGGGDVEFN